MKVKIWDKNLWKDFFSLLAALSAITGLIFIFFDIPEKYKLVSAVLFVIFLVLTFLVLWLNANKISKLSLKINTSILEIEVGNIFNEKGFKVIAFNEYFDTQVDDVIISGDSLNGQYIKRFYKSKEELNELDKIIFKNEHLTDCIVDANRTRKNGKTAKYKLGTIIRLGEYFLLAFSHFDKENRAYLEINDYTSCLMNMWNECDIHYAGKTVVFPLLGSGITRFHGYENITDQDPLHTTIWTVKTSRIRFQYPSRAKIILTQNSFNKINLYEIKKRFSI